MRQTLEHRPYIGSRAVLSGHGQSPLGRSKGHRRGFTLIEVMIALVIIGLAGLGLATFSMQSYRAVQNLTIRATAENLAEVTLEELSSMGSTILSSMTQPSSGPIDINFPGNGYVEGGSEAWAAAALYNDSSAFDSITSPPKFTPPAGTYHVLCNGQLLLGTYDSFFPNTSTPGQVGYRDGGGAVVKSDGTDLFASSPWDSKITSEGPVVNDYQMIYSPSQLAVLGSLASGYEVYKYGLASGTYLEPIYKNMNWHTAGLLVFASTAPHLYREVTITDVSTATSARIYSISIRVIWTFGGVRQLVEVTGGKTDLR